MRLCCSFRYHKIYLVICYLVEISLSDMTEVKGCSQMMSLSFNEQANIGRLVPDTVVPLLGRDNSSLGVSHSGPVRICNSALSECVAARLRSQLIVSSSWAPNRGVAHSSSSSPASPWAVGPSQSQRLGGLSLGCLLTFPPPSYNKPPSESSAPSPIPAVPGN